MLPPVNSKRTRNSCDMSLCNPRDSKRHDSWYLPVSSQVFDPHSLPHLVWEGEAYLGPHLMKDLFVKS